MVKMTKSRRWPLHAAKARLSELVRKARTEGPQRITVHGREEVVVVSVEDYRRTKGEPTGEALVKLLRDSPLRDINFDRKPVRSPIRKVKL